MSRCLFALVMVLSSVLSAVEIQVTMPAELVPGASGACEVTLINPPTWGSTLLFPEVEGLTFRESRGAKQNTIIINGTQRVEESRSFHVTPSREGTFHIPWIRVRLNDGTDVTSTPQELTVTSGDPSLVGEAACRVTFTPATAVIGQQVRLTYRIAFPSETLRFQDPGISPPPLATVIQEDDLRQGEAYAADGSKWFTYSKSWLLTFEQPGTIEVTGQQTYYQCERRRDFFDTRWVAVGAARRAAVKPATITITDVPVAGRPDDWSGLIGRAKLVANLERDRISTGEGVRLTITLTGDQIERAKPPTLPKIDGVRAYERDAESSSTRRVFSWDLVPTRSGRFAIPPVTMSSFDAEQRAFSTISSAPQMLEVLPGRDRDLTITGTSTTTENTPLTNGSAAAVLPPPLRSRSWSPGPWHILGVFAGTFVMIAGFGSLRGRESGRNRGHRGKQLARCLRAQDLNGAAQAVQALRSNADDELRAICERVLQRIDDARFGGSELTLDDDDRRRLEGQR